MKTPLRHCSAILVLTLALAACDSAKTVKSSALSAVTGMEVHETYRSFNRTEWEERAAIGAADGHYEIGLSYLEGTDGEQDFVRGTRWLCEAAKRGDIRAQVRLGDFYAGQAQLYGLAVNTDDLDETEPYDVLAYAWYDIAARNFKAGNPYKRFIKGEIILRKRNNMLKNMTPENTECGVRIAKNDHNTPCLYGVHTRNRAICRTK